MLYSKAVISEYSSSDGSASSTTSDVTLDVKAPTKAADQSAADEVELGAAFGDLEAATDDLAMQQKKNGKCNTRGYLCILATYAVLAIGALIVTSIALRNGNFKTKRTFACICVPSVNGTSPTCDVSRDGPLHARCELQSAVCCYNLRYDGECPREATGPAYCFQDRTFRYKLSLDPERGWTLIAAELLILVCIAIMLVAYVMAN
jgi:hypothetical protein